MGGKDKIYELELGAKLYFKDNLNYPVILYDVLPSVYPKHLYLYYMIDDERPYRRSDFYTQTERRKIIIDKFIKNLSDIDKNN